MLWFGLLIPQSIVDEAKFKNILCYGSATKIIHWAEILS